MKPTVCIIGSGIGGGIAALEIARSGVAKVILVDTDSIGESYTRLEEKTLESDIVGQAFNQEATRAFGYGGSSNLWNGVLTTLDEEDWVFIDIAAGSKISDDVKLFYKESRKYFGNESFDLVDFSRPQKRINQIYREIEDSGKFKSKNFYYQMRPFRVKEELARVKDSCSDLIFSGDSVALYLIKSQDNPSKVTGLVVCVDGQRKVLEADYYILALGALETPRIILQGNKEVNGFDLINKNVGRMLFDHPWTVLGELKSKKGWFKLGLSDVYASSGLRYRIGYRLQDAVENPKIGTNHSIAIKPLFFGDYAIFKEAMKALISSTLSVNSIAILLKRFRTRDIFASIFLLVCEKFGFGVLVRRALVFCYLEQPNRPESSVELSNRRDVYGRYVPKINWIIGNEEVDGLDFIQRTFASVFVKSAFFEFINYDNIDRTLASGSHHAGTMRIGQNAENGVVDKDLKIFGTTNAYVCDLSIFPNCGNSNPTLTLAAFSFRLAKHIITAIPSGSVR
jgi:choline dehydrogenase-like flavoprotein